MSKTGRIRQAQIQLEVGTSHVESVTISWPSGL
jgi:hypothetical protein